MNATLLQTISWFGSTPNFGPWQVVNHDTPELAKTFHAWLFFFLFTMTGLILPLTSSTAIAATQELDKIAVVTQAVGKVWAIDGKGAKRNLQINNPIYHAETLQTEKDSSLKLRFVDNTFFDLGQEGNMVMDEYVYDPKIKVGKFASTISQGIFHYKSGKLAKLAQIEHTLLRTPRANIGIRGSELQGEVAKDGSAVFVHRSGFMNISDSSGRFLSSLSKSGNAVSFSSSGQAKFFQAPKSLLNRLNKGVSAKPTTGSTTREKQATEDAPLAAATTGGDGGTPPSDGPGSEVPPGEGPAGGEKAVADLKDSVEMDAEKALELFQEAVKSGKMDVDVALEAVLMGLKGNADKETIKQILSEAIESGISLDDAKKLVKKIKKSSGCF